MNKIICYITIIHSIYEPKDVDSLVAALDFLFSHSKRSKLWDNRHFNLFGKLHLRKECREDKRHMRSCVMVFKSHRMKYSWHYV